MICTSPSTGEVIGTINAYTTADVKDAYEAARVAAEDGPNSWNKTTFEERRAVLQEIMDWIVANQQEIIELSVRDSGKTVTEASMGEVMISCEKIRWIIQNGEKCLQREYRPVAALLAFTKQAYVDYKPLGVIGVIVPWYAQCARASLAKKVECKQRAHTRSPVDVTCYDVGTTHSTMSSPQPSLR